MAERYLGMGFEIHGRGSDLIFPHHENEIAQAEALTGREPFARHWLHAGMVQMAAEKMSKSLGNVALAREVLETYPAEAVRYWMLQGSYRSQVVFSEKALDDAVQGYERWRTFADSVRHALGEMPRPAATTRSGEEALPEGIAAPLLVAFAEAMDDDFNSAEAFASVHELVREGNKRLPSSQSGDAKARGELAEIAGAFAELTNVLGFSFPAASGGSELAAGFIEYLLDRRERARSERDFAQADEIRDKLTELGVVIEDTPGGARWRVSVS